MGKIAFIGIDPSINSTGISVRFCHKTDNNDIIEDSVKFYILKPDTKETTKTGKTKSPLSAKEIDAEKRNSDILKYLTYYKVLQKDSDSTEERELCKTQTFIHIIDAIKQLIIETMIVTDEIYICIEGISYGSSIRTVSVFDLAGLNYLIRFTILNILNGDGTYMQIVPPTSIKKFATGKGNANKDLVIEVFNGIYGKLNIPKVDDIADAFFMSRLAQRYYEKEHL